MKLKLFQARQILPVFLLALICFTANAQKLPATQQVSLWVPANIKVDGKTTEWGDKFQAYNPTSRIFYTVSNDDRNLYLTVRMEDLFGNEKALNGGITFTVSPLPEKGQKRKDVKDISVTYPVIENKYNSGREAFVVTVGNSSHYKSLSSDTDGNRKKIDSLVIKTNRRMTEMFKEVQVAGIKEIADPIISIYNATGILVAAQFNESMKYTYEMAIPIKYLGTSIKDGGQFKYNIRLNATPTIATIVSSNLPGPPIASNLANVKPDILYVNYPTDFGGEYTLAKK